MHWLGLIFASKSWEPKNTDEKFGAHFKDFSALVSCVFFQKRMCVFLLNLCNNILSWWFEFFCISFCFWFVKLTDVKRAEMSGVTGVVTRTQKRLLSRWRCGDPAICPSSAECTVTNSATRSRRTSRNWGWGNVLKVGTITSILLLSIVGHWLCFLIGG